MVIDEDSNLVLPQISTDMKKHGVKILQQQNKAIVKLIVKGIVKGNKEVILMVVKNWHSSSI